MKQQAFAGKLSIGLRLLGLALWTVVGCGGGNGDGAGGAAGRGRGGEPVSSVTQAATTRPTVTPPTPQGPTGLDAITGVGKVEPDGSFHYAIPIEVPPGRAGMTPDVTLSYSSSGGNGPLGMGWSLNATSVISRCPAMKTSGRLRDTVQFTGPDTKYCLDGQRLIQFGGTNEYRTEVDSFARIKIVASGTGGPTRWTVEHKNGRIATYSVLPETIAPTGPWTRRSVLNANGTVNGASEVVTLYWPMIEERDRLGNTVLYDYERSNGLADGSSAPLLSKLTYTRCASCGYPNTQDRVVTFGYEARSAADRLEQYTNGVAIKTTKRLSQITTAISDGTSSTIQRRYYLNYMSEGGTRLTRRTLLSSIAMCDSGVTCTPETKFLWQMSGSYEQSGGGFNQFSYEANLDNTNLMEIAVFDANGDGNDDVLLYEPSVPAVRQDPTAPQDNPILPVPGTTYTPKVLLGDGGGHFSSAVNVSFNTTPWPCTIYQMSRAIPVDLDGNGTTELVVECARNEGRQFGDAVVAQYRVLSWQGTPGALSEVTVPGLTGMSVATEQLSVGVSCSFISSGILRFGDLTGDGLPEMLYGIKDGTWRVQRASKTVQSPATAPQVSYGTAIDTKLRATGPITNGLRTGGTCQPAMSVSTVLDENGDGHAELVQFDMQQSTRSYFGEPNPDSLIPSVHKYAFNDYTNNVSWVFNAGATPTEPTSGSFNWGTANFVPPQNAGGVFGTWVRPWQYLDINGDGLKDALYLAGTLGWQTRINTGTGYAAPVTLPTNVRAVLDQNTYDPNARWQRRQDHGLQIADMNGDGRDDLVLLASSNNDTPWQDLNLRWRRSLDPVRILYSNGTGFDAPVALNVANNLLWASNPRPGTPQFAMSGLGDVNGDGLADVIGMIAGSTPPKRRLMTWSYGSKFPGGVNRMLKVEVGGIADGAGVVEDLVYDNLSLGGVARSPTLTGWDTHTPKRGGDYPAASTARGTVVKKYYSNPRNGTPTAQHWRYYSGLRDRLGRGFIGFAESKVLDVYTGVFTHFTFDQRARTGSSDEGVFRHYVEARRPSVTLEWDAPDSSMEPKPDGFFGLAPAAGIVTTPKHDVDVGYTGHPLRMEWQRLTTYHQSSTGGRLPHTSQSASPSQSVETHYDEYGNPITIEEFYDDKSNPGDIKSYTKDTTIEYANELTTWFISRTRRITEVTETKNPYLDEFEPGESDAYIETRVTDVFFKPNTERIEWIIREANTTPDNPNTTLFEPAGIGLKLTQFTYNSAGLLTQTREYGPAINTCPTGQTCTCTSDANCAAGQTCMVAVGGAAKQCFNQRDERLEYDPTGTVAEGFTNALGQKRWELYDPKRMWLYATVDYNDVKTLITRDIFGRTLRVASDTGAFEQYSYETVDKYRIARITRGGGPNGVVFYDVNGRPDLEVWSTFSGGTGVSRTIYNAVGAIREQSYNTSTTALTTTYARGTALTAINGGTVAYSASYDTAGRPTSISTAPSIAGSTYAYDALGSVTETDATGLRNTMVRDVTGRVTKSTQYTGIGTAQSTTYRYKGNGALAMIIQAGGLAERFTYDTVGRPTGWRNVSGAGDTRRFIAGQGYDGFDQLRQETRDGVQIIYTRDKLGRMTSRTAAGETQTYSWDPAGGIGHLNRATNGNHEISFSSFDKGRPGVRRERFIGGTAAETTSLSFGYTYDGLGRLDTLRYPEAPNSGDSTAVPRGTFKPGPLVKYNYQNGQIASITEPANANAKLWEVTARHVLGMATGAKYGASLPATWSYNARTLRTEGHNVTSGVTGGPLPSQSFVYAANYRLSNRTTNGVLERYTYDGSTGWLDTYHREQGSTKRVDANFDYSSQALTSVTTTNWNGSPDWPNVNESFTFKSPTDLHQIDAHTSGGIAQTYTYDTAGRVDQVKQGTTIKRDFDWNSFNLPSQIRYFGPDVTRTFAYDAFGSRVKKTQDASNEVLYLGKAYEARNLSGNKESVFRLFADVGIVAELVHPWGSNTRTTRYIFTDEQGSPAFQVVESGSTRVSTELGFFPFGKRKNSAPSQAFSQLGYTGHVQDDDLGLVNMEGRILDLTTRRFLSRDRVPDSPLKTQGTNPYAYATNDPVNRVDPTGFDSEDNNDDGERGVTWVEDRLGDDNSFYSVYSGFEIEDLGSGCLCSDSADVPERSSSDDDDMPGDETDDFDPGDHDAGISPAFVPPVVPLFRPSSGPRPMPRPSPRVTPRGGGNLILIPIVIMLDYLLHEDDEIPVLEVSHQRMPFIARHIDRAQLEDGKPFLLHKAPDWTYDARRDEAIKQYKKAPEGWSLDEYPFASSHEGGKNASVTMVPSAENSKQGWDIMMFFFTHSVTDGDPFIVVTVP